MKCVCGYEYQNPDEVEGRFIQGNRKFLRSAFRISFIDSDMPHVHHLSYVYACPKCHTLKIKVEV